MASQPLVPRCQDDAQQALSVIDHTKMTLESARQTNSPREMRAAVEGLQAALTKIQSQLASCRAVSSGEMDRLPGAAAASGDHSEMGQTMAAPPAAPAVPMDHSKMGHTMPMRPAVPADAIDPVCEMKVDTRNALKVTHKGTDYYFCSDPDRQAFVTDPAKYLSLQPR